MVRNSAGYPAAVINGDVVYTATAGTDLAQYLDLDLRVDRWSYYALFVHDYTQDEWVRAGIARAFVPKDYGGAAKMLSLLPEITHSDSLSAFMSVVGYSYDLLRNDINSLLDLYDARTVSYDLVPLLLAQLGIPIETELEPEQYRRFLRNAVRFYKTKGTIECVRGIVSAITGWQCEVQIGTNMLWNADQSDLIGSSGLWEINPTDASVTWQQYSDGNAVRLTSLSAGHDIGAAPYLGYGPLTPLGVPVIVGTSYTFSGLVRASDLQQSLAHLEIQWYDLMTNLLSTSSGTAIATRQGIYSTLHVSAAAPTNAVWAIPRLAVAATTLGSYWEFRTLDFVKSDHVLPHEPSRDIRIYLDITDTDPLRRQVHLSRLNEVLPRYLPLGATYTLIDGAAPGGYVSDDIIVGHTGPPPPTAPVGRSLQLRWADLVDGSVPISLRWGVIADVAAPVSLRWSVLV